MCCSITFPTRPADVYVKWISSYSSFCENSRAHFSKKKKKINENKFIHSHYLHFLRLYIRHFLSQITVRLQLNMVPFSWPIFFNGSFKLLLRNPSKDCVDFLDHLGICSKFLDSQFTFQRWKQTESGKSLSTKRLFPLSIFLISHKILWCNVVRSKYPFSCLHSNTLSEHTYYFRVLTSRIFEYAYYYVMWTDAGSVLHETDTLWLEGKYPVIKVSWVASVMPSHFTPCTHSHAQ